MDNDCFILLDRSLAASQLEVASLRQLRQLAAEATSLAEAFDDATRQLTECIDAFRDATQHLVRVTTLALNASDALQASAHLLNAAVMKATSNSDAGIAAEVVAAARQFIERAEGMRSDMMRGVLMSVRAEADKVLLLIADEAARD